MTFNEFETSLARRWPGAPGPHVRAGIMIMISDRRVSGWAGRAIERGWAIAAPVLVPWLTTGDHYLGAAAATELLVALDTEGHCEPVADLGLHLGPQSSDPRYRPRMHPAVLAVARQQVRAGRAAPFPARDEITHRVVWELPDGQFLATVDADADGRDVLRPVVGGSDEEARARAAQAAYYRATA
ncbi:MAG: hypothetical protein Q8Q14_02705 [Gemmatimonadales bacterium]|nr:hypothetical protein [Gemmatimonadales bacterium]